MTAWLSMRELGMLKLPPRNQQGLGAADKEEPASPGLSPQHRLFYVGSPEDVRRVAAENRSHFVSAGQQNTSDVDMLRSKGVGMDGSPRIPSSNKWQGRSTVPTASRSPPASDHFLQMSHSVTTRPRDLPGVGDAGEGSDVLLGQASTEFGYASEEMDVM